jgi:hypothetical protein
MKEVKEINHLNIMIVLLTLGGFIFQTLTKLIDVVVPSISKSSTAGKELSFMFIMNE